MGEGDFERLVGGEEFAFESVEVIVVEDGPPRCFGNSVLGHGFAPGLDSLPLGGHGSGGSFVVWPDGAAREKQHSSEKKTHTHEARAVRSVLSACAGNHQGLFSGEALEAGRFAGAGCVEGAAVGAGTSGLLTSLTCTSCRLRESLEG